MTLSAIYARNPRATAVRRSGQLEVRYRPALRGAMVVECRAFGDMFWRGYGVMGEDLAATDWVEETDEPERRAA